MIIVIKLLWNNAQVSRIRNRCSFKKTFFQSGNTTLIVSNKEIGLFIKYTSGTIQNEAKEQKGGFLSMLLGIFGVSLLENLFTDKGSKWSNIVQK